MNVFRQKFPSPRPLLGTTPQELAHVLLEIMQSRATQPTAPKPHPGATVTELIGEYAGAISPLERIEIERELTRHVKAAWQFLEKGGFIEPEDGINGENGYYQLTKQGARAATVVDFDALHLRQALSPEMLHPKLRDWTLDAFRSGEFGAAIFEAFKQVEIYVRTAAGLSESDFGQLMMRKAFAKNGPLSVPAEADSRREAHSRLFEGALGVFKNPQGHATPLITVEAAIQELALASRLLSIVDERMHQRAGKGIKE